MIQDQVRREIGVISQVFPSATQHHSHILPLLQESSDSDSTPNSPSNNEETTTKKFGVVLRTAADFKTRKEYEIWLLREILGVNSRTDSKEISTSVSSSSNETSEDEKSEIRVSNTVIRQRALTFSHDTNTDLELEEVLEIQADISLQELRSRLISNLEDPFGLGSENDDFSFSTPNSKQTPAKSSTPKSHTHQIVTPITTPIRSSQDITPSVDHPFAEELEELNKYLL